MAMRFLGLGILVLILSCSEKKEMEKTYPLYVGTYTDNGSEGIYKFTFDPATGALADQELATSMGNPSFLRISPDKKYLYAVEETDKYENSSGGVTAFEIDGKKLKKINANTTVGAHPCHIGTSDNGDYLVVSSYTGGNLTIFKLGKNGGLLPNPQFIDHKVLDTTATSHVHAAKFTQDGLFVADLGLDAVLRYTLRNNKWVPYRQPPLVMAPKAGPRHFTFDRKGKFLYVINELNSTLTAFKRNGDGSYIELETQSTLASDFEGDSYCADIHLSKDGNFLYGSNRGENTIVIFKVNQDTGTLSLVGRESVKGNWPRNFALDPSDNFLLVANQRSNNIVVFKRDIAKGTLNFLHEVQLPNPVCLEFLD